MMCVHECSHQLPGSDIRYRPGRDDGRQTLLAKSLKRLLGNPPPTASTLIDGTQFLLDDKGKEINASPPNKPRLALKL